MSAREQEDQAGEEKLEKTQAKILSDLKQVKRELNGRIESEFVAHRGQHDDLITELATALMRSRQEKTAAQDNQE